MKNETFKPRKYFFSATAVTLLLPASVALADINQDGVTALGNSAIEGANVSWKPDDKSLACANDALGKIDIPNAQDSDHEGIYTAQVDGKFVDGDSFYNIRRAVLSEEFEITSAIGSRLARNQISAEVAFVSNDEITFSAVHDGTLASDVLDGASTNIVMTIENGVIIDRYGYLNDFGNRHFDVEHVQWTVGAAQTLEHEFTECMNISASPERPANSAVEVNRAPDFMLAL